ncbi:MAG: hypothetical protein KAG66_20415, partial [Methylococcales bacterium]|nr:hypothetical protein [Methylococcales bacterium]
LLLPLTIAYGWYTISQLWLAGVLAYIFGRVLGLRRSSAFIAGLIYQGSGFILVSAAVFPMIIGAAAWLPLLLACINLIVQRTTNPKQGGNTLPIVIVGAIALGFQILAGHIEITYYTLLVMAGYGAWKVANSWWQMADKTQSKIENLKSKVLKPLLWLSTFVTLGIMLGAIQFIPFYEVGKTNFREGSASFADVRSYGYKPRRILTLIMPNFFGNPTHHDYIDPFSGERVPFTTNTYGESNPHGAGTSDWGTKNYVEGGICLGILPLLLAEFGEFSGIKRGREEDKRRGQWEMLFFLGLSLLSLAFIFGTPLYALLYYSLPGINQLHSPFRWVFPLSLSVAMLAGFGADWVGKEARVPSGLVVFAGIFTLIGLIASRFLYPSLEGSIERLFMGLALAPDAFANVRQFYGYEFWQVFIFGGVLVASGV